MPSSSFVWLLLLSLSSFFCFGGALTTQSLRPRCRSTATVKMVSNPFGGLVQPRSRPDAGGQSVTIAEKFIETWNANQITQALDLLDDNIVFEDTIFPRPFIGKEKLERVLRLGSEIQNREIVIIDNVVNDERAQKIGIRFHTQFVDGTFDKKGAASFVLNANSGLIQNVFWVLESSKSGEANLRILRLASSVLNLGKAKGERKFETTSDSDSTVEPLKISSTISLPSWFNSPRNEKSSAPSLPNQYFAAWNERDMTKACSVFSENCEYDDTAFPKPFQGKEALERHLNICADCFPSTFKFCIDDEIISSNKDKTLVQWHVENNGEPLPFTRGCSFYTMENGKIVQGIDFVEPAVWKTGGISLTFDSIVSKVLSETIRIIPLKVWVIYIYVVFFSDWFYGLPATALEQRTWEEVRDLSLNFFLVSPLLHLPFAPVVHPMLEGVFNLLLSWAALFAGFLSDDRREKPNIIPMLPMVVGMQFLTSAFLLPYLATRSNENLTNNNNGLSADNRVYREDLGPVGLVSESRWLAPVLAFVGTGSIAWGVLARTDDFGGFAERLTSFQSLLSIDRVGSSFLVDLAIFALFQGWLINDDVKRRGMDPSSPLVFAGKFIPFFGMAAYLTFRDPLPSKEIDSETTVVSI